METPVVSAAWLKLNLDSHNLVILDATIPVVTNNSENETKAPQIKGARFFDLKGKFSDTTSSLPTMMPSAKQFEAECRKLGINTNSQIVVYDNKGIYSSPRVWFMFFVMGHNKVAVLDGGLPEWLKHNGNIQTTNLIKPKSGNFTANFSSSYIKDVKDVVKNIATQTFLVVDARSEDRFLGKVAEPRKHLKRGHIPNAINLPFTTLLKNGKFLPKAQLTQKFKNLSLNNLPLLFSCGSGITASILLLAAKRSIKNEIFLYDGSWTEWGEGDNFPISN